MAHRQLSGTGAGIVGYFAAHVVAFCVALEVACPSPPKLGGCGGNGEFAGGTPGVSVKLNASESRL